MFNILAAILIPAAALVGGLTGRENGKGFNVKYAVSLGLIAVAFFVILKLAGADQ